MIYHSTNQKAHMNLKSHINPEFKYLKYPTLTTNDLTETQLLNTK